MSVLRMVNHPEAKYNRRKRPTRPLRWHGRQVERRWTPLDRQVRGGLKVPPRGGTITKDNQPFGTFLTVLAPLAVSLTRLPSRYRLRWRQLNGSAGAEG